MKKRANYTPNIALTLQQWVTRKRFPSQANWPPHDLTLWARLVGSFWRLVAPQMR